MHENVVLIKNKDFAKKWLNTAYPEIKTPG